MTSQERFLPTRTNLSAFFAGVVAARRQLNLVAAQASSKGGVRDGREDR